MTIVPILGALRVSHYVKNLFVFLPAFFGGAFLTALNGVEIWMTLVSFCALSSIVYIINDLSDIESDKVHPTKKFRPIASGALSKNAAIGLAVVLAGLVLFFGYFLINPVRVVLIIYFIMNLLYSFGLKKIAILDIFIVATGFVLRVVAGGLASDIVTSKWLFIMTFLLSLGLVLGKRYDDLKILETKSQGSEKLTGSKYNMEFVRNAIVFVMTISTVCYIQYSVDEEIAIQFNTHYFYVTVLPVLIGVLRYFAIVFIEGKSASPVKIATKDPVMLTALGLWVGCFIFFLYLR